MEIAEWLVKKAKSGTRFIVGIDHAFSFPRSYFCRYKIRDWGHFLDDFTEHWPLDEPHVFVDQIREEGSERVGTNDELRLTERWTSSAKSVFQFDVQGQVAKSSHTGIPWLRHIRREVGNRVHFWPFDGWSIPEERSVIAEVYPSIFRKRYERIDESTDRQDAYSVAGWLQETERNGFLSRYFHPLLSEEERKVAKIEGWILGIT